MADKKTIWQQIAVYLKKEKPELYNQVTVQMNEQPAPAAPAATTQAPVQAAEVKTKDGKTLSIEGELGKGAPVFITDEAGQKIPAPDGDYMLEDGSVLKVTGGLIADLVAGEPAPVEQAAPAQFSKADAEVLITEALKSRDAEITALKTELAKVSQSQTLFAELAEAIKNTPVDSPETSAVKWEDMAPIERYRYWKSKNG